MKALGVVLLATLPVIALVSGCGDDATPPKATPGGAVPAQTAAASARPPGADAGAPAVDPTAGMPPLPLRDFGEKDFNESDVNRDPFRSYAEQFVQQAKTKVQLQRTVLAEKYALDELKLQGIVTGSEARALLVDPGGEGWRPRTGDFVGKAEVVHSGGPTGADVAINWRVDRIREGEVVFIREDPSHPEIPPTTHVATIRTPDDEANRIKSTR